MSSTIHCKYRYVHSTVQTAEDRRHKSFLFAVCRYVMLNLSNSSSCMAQGFDVLMV